jgi:hypothetical protein
MKRIFVRTAELGSDKPPEIIAIYEANIDVAADAHGSGATMFELPDRVIVTEGTNPEIHRKRYLAEDWKEQSAEPILRAEAKRRIEEIFKLEEQLTTLYEAIDLMVQHGTDLTKWPTPAKDRKAEIDQMWNYVREINARVRAHKSVPIDPTSDKNWPTRIKKK